MKRVIKHGGISFLIIKMNSFYYLLDGNKIFEFMENNDRKSIPYDYIVENGYLIKEGFNKELDELKSIRTNGKDFIARFEAEEKDIGTVKDIEIIENNKWYLTGKIV